MDYLNAPRLNFGKVMHQRMKPVGHRFVYGVFFLTVPLARLSELGNGLLKRDRFGLLSFLTRDYGPRDGSDLDAWMRKLLREEGIASADGEIVLHSFPRVLGYVFNPISLWYCHDKSGALRAVLAEVSNTFGERHNYLVAHGDERVIAPGDWLMARKVFHVSPFCEVKGHYRFRFDLAKDRIFAQIDYHDGPAPDADTGGESSAGVCADTKLLVTTVHGHGVPIADRAVLKAFFAYPLMTFGVIFRIHWQALRLWGKRVPFFSKPNPPLQETTR
jgi:DUF1365 family protein